MIAREPPGTLMVVCAALRIEARALARGLDRSPVVRVGQRARRAAGRLPDFGALAIAGFGGALDPALRPGDVFVASEISGAGRPAVRCPTAPALAEELVKEGVRARTGPLVTADHIVRDSRERAELALVGGRAVDMESAVLADVARGRPLAAVRVIVDGPDHPLLRPGTVRDGLTARRVLRLVGPALERWGAGLDRDLDGNLLRNEESP